MFCNLSSMTSLQHQLWIGSLIALLYNIGLCIFLLHSVIDIAVSSCFLSKLFSNIVGMLIIVASMGCTFCGLLLDLGSPASAFLFAKDVSSMGHLVNSFAPFSDLLIYGSFAITICFVCRTQI